MWRQIHCAINWFSCSTFVLQPQAFRVYQFADSMLHVYNFYITPHVIAPVSSRTCWILISIGSLSSPVIACSQVWGVWPSQLWRSYQQLLRCWLLYSLIERSGSLANLQLATALVKSFSLFFWFEQSSMGVYAYLRILPETRYTSFTTDEAIVIKTDSKLCRWRKYMAWASIPSRGLLVFVTQL